MCGKLEEPASGPQALPALGTDVSASFYSTLALWVGKPQLHPTSQEGQQVSKQGFSSRPLLFPTLAPPLVLWTSPLSPFAVRRQVVENLLK